MSQVSDLVDQRPCLGFDGYLSVILLITLYFGQRVIYAQEPSIDTPLQASPQRALDLNKKVGISLLTIANGQSALGLNWGISSNSFLEVALSSDWRQPTSRAAESQLHLVGGAHLQLIQARDVAALTLGGRFQVKYSELCTSDIELCAERSIVSKPTPQYKLDIPLRIYWYPNPYISVHSEIGIDIQWGESGATEEDIYLSGYRVSLFSQSSGYGKLGLTIWF